MAALPGRTLAGSGTVVGRNHECCVDGRAAQRVKQPEIRRLRQRDFRQLVTHNLPTLEPRIDQTSAQSFEVLGIPGDQREPMSPGRSRKERIHNT